MKKYYTYEHMTNLVLSIRDQANKDNFKPNYILGLSRGGLVPAVELSHLYNVPLKVLDVTTREVFEIPNDFSVLDTLTGNNVLIVDDVCDSGLTLEMVKENLPANVNAKFACCFNKVNENDFPLDYSGEDMEDNPWIVFPWEAILT